MTVMPVSAPVPARNKMKYDRREMPIHDGHAIPGGARLETHARNMMLDFTIRNLLR